MFLAGASALDGMRVFRTERVRVICSGHGARPLVGGGRLIVHVLPFSSFMGAALLDLREIHRHHEAFRPLGTMGLTPRFNLDGFINERGGDNNHGYTQVFRNGVVEAAKASIIREHEGRRLIPGIAIEKHFFEVVPGYFEALRALGVPAPLCVMITLEGVNGAAYTVGRHLDGDGDEPPLNRNEIALPECVIDEYGDRRSYTNALRPAFDALWNASGYAEARTFNTAGEWIGGG